MRILAYCLMPNHFHLALWPREDGDLSRWMHWLMTTHVRRYLGRYRSSGHVWQGRFKAFPTQEDEHLLTCAAIHRAQPAASRAGRASRSLAVVEPALALGTGAGAGAAGAGHGAARDAVGGGRQCGHGRHRPGDHSANRCVGIARSGRQDGRWRRPERWVWSIACDRGDDRSRREGPGDETSQIAQSVP